MTVCPAKTQISLGIHPVWSESSLCAQWVAKDPSFLHADSEDSDQTGRAFHFVGFVMRHIAGRTCHFVTEVLVLYANSVDPDQMSSDLGLHFAYVQFMGRYRHIWVRARFWGNNLWFPTPFWRLNRIQKASMFETFLNKIFSRLNYI